MTPKEAFDELGLDETATLEDVKAAYRRRGKETHPDVHPDDPDAAAKFRRVTEAYDTLKEQLEAPDILTAVRSRMEKSRIFVLADGTLENANHIKRPETPAQYHRYLQQSEVTVQSFVDEMSLEERVREAGHTRTQLSAAVRLIVSTDSKQRTRDIYAPLLVTLGQRGRDGMLADFSNLAAQMFKGPIELIVFGLLHLIWQVHRKMLGLEVSNHLIPVVWSTEQGTGKSTFVRRFCSPLQELFSPPVAMSDFLDTRFSSSLSYAVVFIDEIHLLTRVEVDALKLTASSEELLRRQLGTSKQQRIRQRSTAFGTANGPAERYLPDPSGHRRFLSIEMSDLRQSPAVWDEINRFDYSRLWRMVNPADPSPIAPYLTELRAHQAANAPRSPLLAWLLDLDLDSDELAAITKYHGCAADPLRFQFNAALNLEWTREQFSREMETYFAHPLTPFRGKHKVKGNAYYQLKF